MPGAGDCRAVRGGDWRDDGIEQGTLEYTKTRKQFGVPLSSFQVLQLQQPVDAGVFEHTLGISQRHDSLRHRPGKCNCPSWSDWRSSECSKGV